MLENMKNEVHTWVLFLKNIGYNFPEELWNLKVGEQNIPEFASAQYSGDMLSFEQLKELAKKLRKEFPDAEKLEKEHENENDWNCLKEKCCFDYDKFHLPNISLCFWVWTYDENKFGFCMTNWW